MTLTSNASAAALSQRVFRVKFEDNVPEVKGKKTHHHIHLPLGQSSVTRKAKGAIRKAGRAVRNLISTITYGRVSRSTFKGPLKSPRPWGTSKTAKDDISKTTTDYIREVVVEDAKGQ